MRCEADIKLFGQYDVCLTPIRDPKQACPNEHLHISFSPDGRDVSLPVDAPSSGPVGSATTT